MPLRVSRRPTLIAYSAAACARKNLAVLVSSFGSVPAHMKI